MNKILTLSCALAAVGLTSGCATSSFVKAYPGAERPVAQLVTVIVPTSVEVRSVNGEKVANVTSQLYVKQYTVATLPGAQTWSVRYSNPMAGGYYADPTSVVTESPWMDLSFRAEEGQVYRLKVTTPDEDSSLRHDRYQVRFSVVAEPAPAGGAIPMAQSSAAVSPPPPTPAAPPPVPHVEVPQTIESAALKQLQNWWQAAGPQERQAFRDWLQTQP
jgi:hypothetical protein